MSAVLVEADMIPVAANGAQLSVGALGYYLNVIVALRMQPAPKANCRRAPCAADRRSRDDRVCAGTLIMGILLPFVTRQLP